MPNTITVYDWNTEIEPMLVEKLGLTRDTFRTYVEVDGERQWRDHWHVFLSLYGDSVKNDNYAVLWAVEDVERETELIQEEYGDWAVPLISAMNEIIAELHDGTGDPDFPDIVVWFSW